MFNRVEIIQENVPEWPESVGFEEFYNQFSHHHFLEHMDQISNLVSCMCISARDWWWHLFFCWKAPSPNSEFASPRCFGYCFRFCAIAVSQLPITQQLSGPPGLHKRSTWPRHRIFMQSTHGLEEHHSMLLSWIHWSVKALSLRNPVFRNSAQSLRTNLIYTATNTPTLPRPETNEQELVFVQATSVLEKGLKQQCSH